MIVLQHKHCVLYGTLCNDDPSPACSPFGRSGRGHLGQRTGGTVHASFHHSQLRILRLLSQLLHLLCHSFYHCCHLQRGWQYEGTHARLNFSLVGFLCLPTSWTYSSQCLFLQDGCHSQQNALKLCRWQWQLLSRGSYSRTPCRRWMPLGVVSLWWAAHFTDTFGISLPSRLWSKLRHRMGPICSLWWV